MGTIRFASISATTKVVIGDVNIEKGFKRIESEFQRYDTKSYKKHEKNFFRGKRKNIR